MQQKHIANKFRGNVEVNKNILVDLAELVRLSPTSCRALFLIIAYADDTNSVITDVNTISKLLGINIDEAKYAIRTLIKNGYIESKEVKLQHENDIIGAIHDRKLYNKTRKKIWRVVGEKLVTTVKLNGTYNRFYVNSNIIKCSNNQFGNIIKHIKGNLFYDNRINNNEIVWEM